MLPLRPDAGVATVHAVELDGLASFDAAVLDPSETARAARFRSDLDRRRFVSRRVLVRRTIGRLVGRDPGDVVLTIGAGGKPDCGHGIEFSASSSKGLFVLAVSTSGPLGCDVERIDPAVDPADFGGCLSPEEDAALARLTSDERRTAFLRCWTRKEAWVKALGVGLSMDPSSFVLPDGDEDDVPGGRRVLSLDVGGTAAAALCVPGAGWVVEKGFFDLSA